jgi:gamma-glutamylcyclotransferase (GGCT)/AIG2-like uncharacterized protein YtfP
MIHQLFVYGTLRDKEVLKRVAGREIVPLTREFLTGYKLSSIELGEISYPILIEDKNSNERIEGDILEVTSEELRLIDEYEGPEYRRIKVVLEKGAFVWVYCQ